MRPNTRAGLDVTWRCQWQCAHCFYRHDPRLHKPIDTPMNEIRDKLDQAQKGGLNHAVLDGYGEPSLCRNLTEILLECRGRGMATSMITNGASPRRIYENCRELGMDHLHFSTHGTEEVLTKISGDPKAHNRQITLKGWMQKVAWPWRTNIAMQRLNVENIEAVVEQEIKLGTFHFVFLGFLPHYEWQQDLADVRQVAAHPAELRPHIEAGAVKLRESGTYFTIRYHPFCHLNPEWWPHVTNARHVFVDPWEWNYELQVTDLQRLWAAARAVGDSHACREPCRQCIAYRHCGGWNRWMAEAFGGADLKAVTEVPDNYTSVWDREGGVFDLNPANVLSGTIGCGAPIRVLDSCEEE